MSKRAHEEWHIDGAVLWDVYCDLKDARGCGPATSRQRSTSPSTAGTTSAGRSATPPPCTAWFVLTYPLGRDRVRVYDGSRPDRACRFSW